MIALKEGEFKRNFQLTAIIFKLLFYNKKVSRAEANFNTTDLISVQKNQNNQYPLIFAPKSMFW